MPDTLVTMDRTALLSVARDWSHWDAPPTASVPRAVDLPVELRPNLALVVQGVRRCGKSTLLSQLMSHYALDRQRCLFVNFEDPRLAQHLDHTVLQALVDAFEAERGPNCTFFFDEIQAVASWQKWLRSQLDRSRGRRFVVTGSNSGLLAGEAGSTLTGRHLRVELFPFDLAEYRLLKPRAKLLQYLAAGGFPEPAKSRDGDRLLRTYFDDIVERDIRERVAARSSQRLRQLLQMTFESAGSELSVRRVAAATGLAPDTAASYLEAAESAYLVFGCPWFAYSARRTAVRNKKYYPVDTGLRRAVITPTGEDRGKQLECATFMLLRQRFRDVCYWRDQGEVDFVVLKGRTPVPVQVAWDGPAERHQRALDAFYEAHPHAGEAVFVTADSFAEGVPELRPES